MDSFVDSEELNRRNIETGLFSAEEFTPPAINPLRIEINRETADHLSQAFRDTGITALQALENMEEASQYFPFPRNWFRVDSAAKVQAIADFIYPYVD